MTVKQSERIPTMECKCVHCEQEQAKAQCDISAQDDHHDGIIYEGVFTEYSDSEEAVFLSCAHCLLVSFDYGMCDPSVIISTYRSWSRHDE